MFFLLSSNPSIPFQVKQETRHPTPEMQTSRSRLIRLRGRPLGGSVAAEVGMLKQVQGTSLLFQVPADVVGGPGEMVQGVGEKGLYS